MGQWAAETSFVSFEGVLALGEMVFESPSIVKSDVVVSARVVRFEDDDSPLNCGTRSSVFVLQQSFQLEVYKLGISLSKNLTIKFKVDSVRRAHTLAASV